MVEMTKTKIEYKGFRQLVDSPTRTWNHQRESCLDHIWLNCQERLLSFHNLVRGASDHNFIICNLSQTDIRESKHNILKRKLKNFNLVRYNKDLEETNWSPLYEIKNAELANSFLTEKIIQALDRAAEAGCH